jgi:hypothetical protein
MKHLFGAAIAMSIIFLSCTKSPLIKNASKELAGKWRYTQTFYSIGGPLIYEPTDNLNQWIVFETNGSFTSNMPQFKEVVKYEIIDSVHVKFITVVQQPGPQLYFYSVDSIENSLTLSPADIICIEGCGSKFRR